MSSSISTSRQALFDLLTAAAALSGVQVTYGLPDQLEQQECVALLGITSGDESTAVLGPGARREEMYRIEVAVKVYNPTGDSTAVDARGFALYDAVRAVVVANTTLSGTVRTAYPVNPRSEGPLRPVSTESVPPKQMPGWVIHIDLSVECHARIV